MKKALLLMLTLLTTSLYTLIAQSNTNCATQPPLESNSKSIDCGESSSSFINYWRKKESYIPSNEDTFVKTVHVSFHIWQRADGSGSLDENVSNINRLKQIISWVNDNYSSNQINLTPLPYTTFLLDDTKLRFVLDSIYFYQDTSIDSSYFYCDGNSNHNSILDDYIRNNYPERLNALPLHLVNGYYAYAAGYSHNGSVLSFYRTNPDMNTNNVHDYWYHQHLVHEIGHSLDLAHTYGIGSQNCNISNLDFLWDVYDTTATRPCSSLTYCDVCILPKDSLNNNILGGGETNFKSALQIGIMHRSTVLNNQWNYGYGMRDYVTGYNVEPLEVTTNQVWDFSMKMYQDLIVKSGVTLIIKCELQFVPEAKVIIEPGAKLILDGGVLTNENYYNSFWQGVQVYGTTSQNQFPSFNPTHQGMLVLKNGAVIEYAHKAATNWRQNSWNEIGGVIQSTNSVFRNNRRDVEFMAYKNYTPNNPNTEIANFSFFKNTSFISDDDFIENGLPQQAHVTLWQVHGIHFTNCHFSNNILSNKSTSGTPNRGIYAINASFKVGSGCSTMTNPCPSSDVLRSSFVGLERAVEITGASSSKAATITRTDFENNVWGVIVEDYDNVSIDRNHFELGNTGYGANTTGLGVGVITNNSTEFIIEENSVYTPNTNLPHRGIIVQNASSNDNRLYKNTLENLLIGTGAYGINHNSNYQNGLQFLCNSYVKNKTAISIGYNVTVDGVRFYQGDFSTKKSAGNTFSNNLLDIDNTANSIVYFHNWGNTEPMAYQGLVTLDTTSIANSCPTIFGGGIIFTPMVLASTLDSLKLVYNVKKDEYNNLHFNYLSLIDNGNTEYLQDQIETDWSDDAWFLRGKLIQESPYLSSDVLLTTAEQNVLPNGMLLEVLLANPDATRGGSFIEKLREVTNNSFPEYMIDYVKNNFDSRTLRTTLEGQMSSVHSELSSTRNYIKYLEKSADEFSYQDRLKTVEMGSDLSHKVGLMDFYIENRQFALADSVLEEIYNDNKMKDEVEFIDNYDSYLLFRTGLGERNLAQLDSTEIDYLKDLAENKGRVAGYAQNILCFFYDICSDIKLLNGSAQTKSMNVSGESPTLNEVLYKINVYPNPTVEFTSLSWEIYDELQNAEFRVFDLQGQEVMFGTIEENKSEKALDVRSLDNGVYILAIFNNGEQKLNQKFVVNKPN